MEENLASLKTLELEEAMNSKYLEILEKTNEQLNHNNNISSNIISSASWLIAFLTIGVTLYLFYISVEQRRERRKTKQRYEKQLQKIEKVSEEEIQKITILFEEMKIKFEEMKGQMEKLDTEILQAREEKEKIKEKEGDTSQKFRELENKIQELRLKREKIQENYNESPLIWATSGFEIGNKFNNKKDFHVCEKCGIVFSKTEKKFDLDNPASVTDFHTINFAPLRANTLFLNHDYELPFERKKIRCPNCRYEQFI